MLEAQQRREMARMLTRAANDRLSIVLPPASDLGPQRVGLTGAPGVGKSSLISRLAPLRAAPHGSLAVLAIDPSSPNSRGALLGDRIRMDAIGSDPRIFVRSVSSGRSVDGLCNNIEGMLRLLEAQGFAEILIETVGVGQSQYALRDVVDTVVAVLSPSSGDVIQAMKAGLMEVADIYVVNKAEMAESRRTAEEVGSVVHRSRLAAGSWKPPVILVSAIADIGVQDLSDAISKHQDEFRKSNDGAEVRRQRVRRHALKVMHQLLESELNRMSPDVWDRSPAAICEAVLARLALVKRV